MTAAEFKESWDACVCAGSANPESRTFKMLDAGHKALEELAETRKMVSAILSSVATEYGRPCKEFDPETGKNCLNTGSEPGCVPCLARALHEEAAK